MSTPIVPSDAPHAVKYDRPTETYRVLNAAGIIVDRYQHDSGDFSGRRAMYRLALEDAAVRDAAAAQAEARAWAADEAAAQAMDASMDMTCACQLCGGPVMPDQACMVGEHMACSHCEAEAYYAAPASDDAALAAHLVGELAEYDALGLPCDARYEAKSAQVRALGFEIGGDGRGGLALLPADAVITAAVCADEPAASRLLWSWAGNAAALRGLMDERHAAWFARQERMRATTGELGLLSREAK